MDDVIRELDQQSFTAEFFDLMGEVECGNRFDPSSPAHRQWLTDRIRQRFASGARFFAAYLDDDTPVGFTAVQVDPELEGMPYHGQYSEIVALGVLPAHRRRGHGSRLLDFSTQHARGQGAYCLYLATYAGAQDTIRLYEKNGFVTVATLPDVHGPKAAGSIYMRKLLRTTLGG